MGLLADVKTSRDLTALGVYGDSGSWIPIFPILRLGFLEIIHLAALFVLRDVETTDLLAFFSKTQIISDVPVGVRN